MRANRRTMCFPVAMPCLPEVLLQLAGCLPRDAMIWDIKSDFYSETVHVFVESEFFAEVRPGEQCQRPQLMFFRDRVEWRWTK